MNYHTVINQGGLLGILLSGIMLATATLYLVVQLSSGTLLEHHAFIALFIAGGIGLLTSGAAWLYSRRRAQYFGRKEALLLVSVSWIGGALVSCLPYWIWAMLDAGEAHPFQSFINCYFESMSGLTTTGASVLRDIEAVPRCLLLWRAITHWLGGLGIVVLFVAVLPGVGVGGKRLFQIESPGPSPEGLQPRIRETARWLWLIYLGLTVAEIALLWAFTPMDGFNAVCHTFATLATGGFSTMNASVGAFHRNPAVDIIIITFMLLAGVNFGLYYHICRGKLSVLRGDVEIRVYLGILLVAAAIVCVSISLSGDPITMTDGTTYDATLGNSIRQGLFTTVSIQTTTGFGTSDFNCWPFVAKAVLIAIMFVGGCSGSTGGGIKVIRIWVALRVMLAEIEHVFRPHVVRPMRVGGSTVPQELRLAAITYTLGIVVLFGVGACAIMAVESVNDNTECDFVTAASSSVATLCNVGPGLGKVGAVENYGWYSGTSKVIMCILMAVGRLEAFAILVLFAPAFWRKN